MNRHPKITRMKGQPPIKPSQQGKRSPIRTLNNKNKKPKPTIKNLMKTIHQKTINYFTYLILNKRKLDQKQTLVNPPPITQYTT